MISYIYYIYFIKQKHLWNMLQDILRPTSIWRLIRSTLIYIGLLVLCPIFISILFQLVVKYFIYRFTNPNSLLINVLKIVALTDILMLLLSSLGAILMYSITILFSELPLKKFFDNTNSIEWKRKVLSQWNNTFNNGKL